MTSVLNEIMNDSSCKNYLLGIETTGKRSQLGTLDEILWILEHINNERITIVIDWAHVYARNRGVFPNTEEDFAKVLSKLEKAGVAKFHFHATGVIHKNGSECKHLSVMSNTPPYEPLLCVLKEQGFDFVIICENISSHIDDALYLKERYESCEAR